MRPSTTSCCRRRARTSRKKRERRRAVPRRSLRPLRGQRSGAAASVGVHMNVAATATPDLDVAAILARLAAYPRRITADSRRVEPGVAFAAYPGAARDGRAFIADAL